MRIELLPAGASDPARPSAAYRRCLSIRHRVFVLGQSVSEELEFDGLDPRARHFLAFDARAGLDGTLGTARMRVVEGDAKAERFAVLEQARGRGIGRALVEAIEAHARSLGLARVRLHAQVQAMPFYQKLGYRAFGDVFVEADIEHRAMQKTLD